MPATSSTQPDKAGVCKYVICKDQVEKLMLCVKTENCGLNTFLIVYNFRRCIVFLSLWLKEEEKGQYLYYTFLAFSTKI